MSATVPDNVRKIAVVRANALGDFIFCLPALQALKEKFPKAKLVYLGNVWHKSFLEERPGPIDSVEIIPQTNGMPHESNQIENQKEVAVFFKRMQAAQFDIAFQMHGGGKNSNPFTKALGAKLTVGLKTPNAIGLDINVPYIPLQNEFLRYLEVVSTVGAKPKVLEPVIQITNRDKQELGQVSIKCPFIVLHPGASDLRRRWPAQKFAAVGNALAKEGYKIYVTGSAYEKAIAEEVMASLDQVAENLCAKISLNALTALLSQADLLISNDTGPLHLARAVKTPTVGIYWCSNAIMSGPLTTSFNRICAEWNPLCPLCGVDCSRIDAHKPFNGCNHETSFIQKVPVAEVLENAKALLKIGKKHI